MYLCQRKVPKMIRNCLFIFCLLLSQPAAAQKRKASVKKAKVAPAVTVVKEEDTKFEEMLGATQQIAIIDSVVVDKQDFLQFYRLTSEAGFITGYNNFFSSSDQPYSTVYVNQLGNKCWYANNGRLYTSDLLGDQWSEPAPLEGLGRFQRTNYPYMLSDGITLYFAAISSEGLGGLDIYVSRYDSESGKYLLSENIGLPFNSDANDYMYVVDEMNGIGFFASDRRQPEGKVCIYTFIPNQKRITYSTDEFDEDVIRSRAKIERIADTWGDETQRIEVLDRLHNAGRKPKEEKNSKEEFLFIINDGITYTRMSDFHDASNPDRFTTLQSMKAEYENLKTELEKARGIYANMATPDEKESLKSEIWNSEQEYYQLESDIRQLEKAIRSTELKSLQ